MYNAGNGVFGSYVSITMDKLDMAMKTNVHGLLAVAQNVGPKMEKRGEGVIVVTGATAALRGCRGQTYLNLLTVELRNIIDCTVQYVHTNVFFLVSI